MSDVGKDYLSLPCGVKLTSEHDRLLQSVVSSEEMGSGSTSPNYRVGMKTERPGFSLPVMSTNFRRFNARYARITHNPKKPHIGYVLIAYISNKLTVEPQNWSCIRFPESVDEAVLVAPTNTDSLLPGRI